jgi:hypothetical protein
MVVCDTDEDSALEGTEMGPDDFRCVAEGRVALVRHARSSHVHAGWITASDFRAWREAYEAAGIREDERVPAHLEQLVGRADLVLLTRNLSLL